MPTTETGNAAAASSFEVREGLVQALKLDLVGTGIEHTPDIRQFANATTYRQRNEYLPRDILNDMHHGVTIIVEPINEVDIPGFFLNTTERARAAIFEVGADNIGLQFTGFDNLQTFRAVAVGRDESLTIEAFAGSPRWSGNEAAVTCEIRSGGNLCARADILLADSTPGGEKSTAHLPTFSR